MSVIMGYKTEDKLYLAADNRLSEKDGTFFCDNERKIVEINNHLAVAFAGNAGIQALFEDFVKGLKNADDFKIEDVLLNINAMILSLRIRKEEWAVNILNSSSYFIIAGKDKNNEKCIYAVSYVNGKLGSKKTEMILFPPSGLDMQICGEIYVRNIHLFHQNFLQKTIKEISDVCNTVSHSGDVWIYDFVTDNSKLEHFD
jgi:hypothetical protein